MHIHGDEGHTHDHGTGEHVHSHGGYTHTHSPEHDKKVMNRLSRAIGHLEKVKDMVERGDDCSQVLIQLAAVRSALTATGKVILQEHISHCIVHAVESGDDREVEELNEAIAQFIK